MGLLSSLDTKLVEEGLSLEQWFVLRHSPLQQHPKEEFEKIAHSFQSSLVPLKVSMKADSSKVTSHLIKCILLNLWFLGHSCFHYDTVCPSRTR